MEGIWVGVIVLGIGLVLAMIGGLSLRTAKNIDNYETYHGIVTTVLHMKRNKTKIQVPMVQIKVNDEVHAHQALDVNGSRTYRENQQINVKWNAKHPEDLYIEGDNTKRAGAIKLLVIAAAVLVAGAAIIIVTLTK